MTAIGKDTLKTSRTLNVAGKEYTYFSLPEAAKTLGDISRLPVSLKVLLENVLRFEDGRSYKVDDAKAIIGWLEKDLRRTAGAKPGQRRERRVGLKRAAEIGHRRADGRNNVGEGRSLRLLKHDPLSPFEARSLILRSRRSLRLEG